MNSDINLPTAPNFRILRLKLDLGDETLEIIVINLAIDMN